MSDRSVAHATFAIERVYEASPARVFEAWADPVAKKRWFGPAESDGSHELDFRIGGQERSQLEHAGSSYTFDARYQDIVPDERIVYAYDMHRDEARISVSLATVELEPGPAGAGTRLLFTEQAAFLDGQDTPAEREQGTGTLLENLAAELQRGRV
jgi:uncharacterized protein YndB with AHSA1/START domain